MNVLRCCLSCEIGWGCYLWCYFFLSGCQFLCILQSCLKSVVFLHGSFCWYIKGWCCVSWKKLVCNGWLIRSCCWVFFTLGMCFHNWLRNLSWDIVLVTIFAEVYSIFGLLVLHWHTFPVSSTLVAVLLSTKLILV